MSLTKVNPFKADMNIFTDELMQVEKSINFNTDPSDIERKIKELNLKYEEGVLRALRAWAFDKEPTNREE